MLDYELAKNSYETIMSSKADSEKDKLFWKAIRYADIRSRYALYDYQQQLASNVERTQIHNELLDYIENLVVKQQELGEDITWRNKIGLGRTGEDRKRVGDFACYIAMFLGLSAR